MLVDCPGCGRGLNVPDEHAGRRVKCPKCGNVVRVEAPAAIPVKQPYLRRVTSQHVLTAIAAVLAVIALGSWVASLFAKRPPIASPASSPPITAADDLVIKSLDRDSGEKERKRIERLNDEAFVSPSILAKEFGDNQLASELKYAGRKLRFGGLVAAVTRNKEGMPVIGFLTGTQTVLRMFIDPADIGDWKDVKAGDQVFVTALLHNADAGVITLIGWRDK